MTQRLEQLTEGTVAIFSSEVERLELDLFTYMRAGGLTKIVAVDLTTNPGVLLTRNRRRAERRRFIGDGGRIQRLFVVSREAMLRPDFAHDARQLLQQEAADGVDVGLVFLEQLRGQQAQDYILYDAFAAVVESVQADCVYSLGVSTIHFRKRDVELFSSLFAEVWPAGPLPVVVRAAQAFMAVPLERLKTATGRRNVQALLDDIYAARA